MRLPLPGVALVCLVLPIAAAAQLLPPLPLPFPLPVPQERSAATRRAAKPAVESRLLDDMENPAAWSQFGPGRMTFTRERARSGGQSIRLTSPTRLDQPGPVPGRPFAETGVRRLVPGEDWSGFNRLVVDVFPHLPGFRHISLLVKFHAAGSERWPYTFGQLHYVLLRPEAWNRVVWEIPHLPRTNVTAIDFIYRLQGNEPAATDTVQFDFDDLRVERVASPDAFHGWGPAPGVLAYCHLGYEPGARKEAVVHADFDGEFQVTPVDGGPPAFRGRATPVTSTAGRFAVLDFSALRTPGHYRLQAGTLRSEPFPIAREVWQPALAATLNHFACQRCGEAVPGIHDACHRDWQVAHGDRRILLDGGWHDAGDLSQGLVNTAEATAALFAVADAARAAGAAAGERFLAEARHGLEWTQRTRFGDGHRATWATMDFWTDGILGTADDVTARASNTPFDNFLAATASARAARLLRETDPVAAAHARRVAEEDWGFALAGLRDRGTSTEVAAAGANAAVELHRTTGRDSYREPAVAFGRILLDAQQTSPPPGWSEPLAGFFHASAERRRTLRYEHRGHHEAPVVALAGLLRSFPEHADTSAWRKAIALHARYLRQTARLTAPWDMPAAGIYGTDEGDAARQRQVRQGLPLDATHYLRRFPVWGDLRGNSGVLLSQACALSAAARALNDGESADLARHILEWHFGRNPFGQSLMYGVGHDFTPQYTAMSGDITGGLPVGIQTRLDEDEPYWPASNCYNYAEIWVHPSSRLLAVLADLAALTGSHR